MPLSFHILTSRRTRASTRGPKLNSFLSIIRGNQDIIGMFIFGGVFERHPQLKIVCVEADAGWVPHYMYRMDHAYKRHRNWLDRRARSRKPPSEYFREHIYTTFQDDWVAFRVTDLLQRAPPDVGQRLPAQRFDVAVSRRTSSRSTRRTSPRRSKRADPPRQRRRALRL